LCAWKLTVGFVQLYEVASAFLISLNIFYFAKTRQQDQMQVFDFISHFSFYVQDFGIRYIIKGVAHRVVDGG
jgi:hypothetical protein